MSSFDTDTDVAVPATTKTAATNLKAVKPNLDVNEYASFRRGDLGLHAPIEDGECVVVKIAGYPEFHGNVCFEPCTGWVHLAGFDGEGTLGLTAKAAEGMLDENGCVLVDMARTRIATDEEEMETRLLEEARVFQGAANGEVPKT